MRRQSLRRLRDLVELLGPIIAAAGIDADLAMENLKLGAIAVDLDFVQPRRDEAGNGVGAGNVASGAATRRAPRRRARIRRHRLSWPACARSTVRPSSALGGCLNVAPAFVVPRCRAPSQHSDAAHP